MGEMDNCIPPRRRTTPKLNKSFQMSLIKNSKDDWFMTLAAAVSEVDLLQSRCLAKAYLLLHDYLPHGLTGVYAHVRGSDIMNVLLSHTTEHAASRHKYSKEATAAFNELEKWMSSGSDWREALEHATPADPGPGPPRRKGDTRAPGLHSPAQLLAILTIAHPDSIERFMGRISGLGIEWMYGPRATLDVQHGFWKGINSANLHTCFAPEKSCCPRVSPAVDYDRLFGPGFVSARKDMRPYWPAALRFTAPPGRPEYDELPEDGDEALRLREHLEPYASKDAQELEAWLVARLAAASGSEDINSWTDHWAERMDRVENFEEQTIVRSLFLQSLCRLQSLASAGLMEQSYMLLDVEDSSPRDQIQNAAKASQVARYPPYVAWAALKAQFSSLADSSPACSCERLFEEQTDFFCEIFTRPPSPGLVEQVIKFDRLRTQLLLWDFRGAGAGDSEQADLLTAENILKLRLTRWQQRCLLLPGANVDRVLTDCQRRLYREEPEPDSMHFIKLSSIAPATVAPRRLDVVSKEQAQAVAKLFGDLKQPEQAPQPAQQARHTRHISQTSQTSQTSQVSRKSPVTSQRDPRQESREASPLTPLSSISVASHQEPPAQPVPKGLTTTPRLLTQRRQGFGSELYSGMKWVPTTPVTPMKRGVDGSPRTNRLVDLTRDDLKGDMRTIRDECGGKVFEHVEGVKGDVEQLRTEITEMQNSTEEQKQATMDAQARAAKESRTILKDLREMNAVTKQTLDRIAELKEALETHTDRQSAAASQGTNRVCDMLQDLREQVTKEPTLREDDYIARACPAPDGYTQQQCRYQVLTHMTFCELISWRYQQAYPCRMVLHQPAWDVR